MQWSNFINTISFERIVIFSYFFVYTYIFEDAKSNETNINLIACIASLGSIKN